MGRFSRTMVCVLIGLSVTACGFHLRGQLGLPAGMESTYIKAPDRRGELVEQLERLLEGNQMTVVDNTDQASAILDIQSERMQRVVQSVGPSARVREFAMEYTVTFRLLGSDGLERVPTREVFLSRDYTFDQQQVLGTTSEEEIIRRDLRRAMAQRILSSLEAR